MGYSILYFHSPHIWLIKYYSFFKMNSQLLTFPFYTKEARVFYNSTHQSRIRTQITFTLSQLLFNISRENPYHSLMENPVQSSLPLRWVVVPECWLYFCSNHIEISVKCFRRAWNFQFNSCWFPECSWEFTTITSSDWNFRLLHWEVDLLDFWCIAPPQRKW